MRRIKLSQDEPKNGSLTHNIVLVTSLPDHSIQIIRPLHATVRLKSGVYMAALVDTAISASGESLTEAMNNLKDIIAAKFHLFSRKENILGKHLRHQLRILRQSLRTT